MSWHLHNIIVHMEISLHLKQSKINCLSNLEDPKNYEWLKYNPDKPKYSSETV